MCAGGGCVRVSLYWWFWIEYDCDFGLFLYWKRKSVNEDLVLDEIRCDFQV